MTTALLLALAAAAVAAIVAAVLARGRAQLLLRRAERAETELAAERRVTAEKVVLVERAENRLGALEVSRRSAYAGLVEQVRSLADGQDRLRTETATLVTALRAPSVRGRWGELQLRRVVEMAGMVEHCDFTEQTTCDGDNGRQRPDLLVRLPGGGSVAIDAKVPLQGYLQAVEAADEG